MATRTIEEIGDSSRSVSSTAFVASCGWATISANAARCEVSNITELAINPIVVSKPAVTSRIALATATESGIDSTRADSTNPESRSSPGRDLLAAIASPTRVDKADAASDAADTPASSNSGSNVLTNAEENSRIASTSPSSPSMSAMTEIGRRKAKRSTRSTGEEKSSSSTSFWLRLATDSCILRTARGENARSIVLRNAECSSPFMLINCLRRRSTSGPVSTPRRSRARGPTARDGWRKAAVTSENRVILMRPSSPRRGGPTRIGVMARK